MSYSIDKKAGPDGWKAVKVGDLTIGHVCKVGGSWRARVGKTEHLGFSTQKAAAKKLESLSG
jgi:hypothetical protein